MNKTKNIEDSFAKREYIKLSDQIFLFKNFISNEHAKTLHEIADSLPEDAWLKDSPEEWFNDKFSNSGSSELNLLHQTISELVSPNYEPLPLNKFGRLKTGQGMYEHADSPGEDKKEEVTAGDPYGSCHIVKYGVILYFSNCEGGEVYYPNLNIEYKPEPGDLLIHSSDEKHTHGVKEVKSGIRYIYPNFIIEKNKVLLPSLNN